MKNTYEMNIAGLKRSLPLCKLNDELYIGAFIMFGDVEITKACATELLNKVPEFDIMIAPEAKAIPLLYEMARQVDADNYIVARKASKLYMNDVMTVDVTSITTAKKQTLCISGDEAAMMKDKRVLIIDDVISTGESLVAVEKLVNAAGGSIVAKAAVLAEGDAQKRDDIIFLEPLPLFDKNGEPIA